MLYIGNFGSKNQINGQCIKTKEFENLLIDIGKDFYKLDTSANLICNFIASLIKNRNQKQIVALGKKGLFVYLLVNYLTRSNSEKIFLLIGGWFENFYKKRIIKLIFPKTNFLILTESRAQEKRLISKGLKVSYFPNFRQNLKISEIKKKPEYKEIKLIFLSRIIKEKGIFESINLVKELTSENINCKLDIYGVGDKKIIQSINQQIENFSNIKFMGKVKPEQSHEIISNYHYLILPTTYSGECMPGVVIEAFFSGTPVLTTDWKSMNEIVTHNENGGVFQPNSFVKDSKEWIKSINKIDYQKMQEKCALKFNNEFSTKKALEILKGIIK